MKIPALAALSYAAIVTVYAAGYERTREAAERFEGMTDGAKPYEIPLPDGQRVRAVRPFVAPPKMATPATAAPGSVPTISAAPAPAATKATPEEAAPRKAESRIAPAPRAAESASAVIAREPESVIASAAAPEPASPVASLAPNPEPAVAPAPVVSAPAPAPVPVIAPAPTPAPAIAPPPPPAPLVLKTGKFLGWGSCRHGDIEAEVQINRGLIIDVRITQCRTQYSCGPLDVLVDGILDHQGPGVNYVAGSTQSTVALYNAVINAIAKAK